MRIILVAWKTDTIDFSLLLEPLGGQPLLAYLGEWLKSENHDGENVLAGSHCRDEVHFVDFAARYNIIWFAATGIQPIHVLLETASYFRARDITLVPPASILCPRTLLLHLGALHRDSAADATLVRGFPTGACPEVYSTRLLTDLDRVHTYGLPAQPRGLIERLMAASAQTHTELPFEIRLTWLEASRFYSTPPQELSSAVSLATPGDLKIVSRVLSAPADLVSDNSTLLMKYKQELVFAARTRASVQGSRCRMRRTNNRARRPRILFVSGTSGFGGAEQILCTTAGAAAEYASCTAIVPFRGILTDTLAQRGVGVICPDEDFTISAVANVTFAESVFHHVNPEVVHLNGVSGFPVLAAAWRRRVPIVQHVHVPELRGYEEQLVSSNSIITVSNFVLSRLKLLDVDLDHAEVVYNGIDTQRFNPGRLDKLAMRHKYALPLLAPVVLIIARFACNKRYDRMIRVLATVGEQIPDLRVVIVGEPLGSPDTYLPSLRMLHDTGLKARTSFHRCVRDIEELETAADVLLLLSEDDPLATCILEAMSLSLPVIATASGGTPELIEHDSTGYLASPTDTDPDVAALVIRVLRDPALRARIGARARSEIIARFSSERFASNIRRIHLQACMGASNTRAKSVARNSIGYGMAEGMTGAWGQ
ncbi:MAG TPA: glycosyltransferase family 4 protein [Bryobacteraceae bacterium]|nr:glycosyltransferase family 4 protein [Bryobacteraceae bacterium]